MKQRLPEPFDKLAEISPNWAKQLSKDPTSVIMKDRNGTHKLEDYACCIVGEAYKFKSNYEWGDCYGEGSCRICSRISEEFDLTITPNAKPTDYAPEQRTKRELPDIINEFVAHWDKRHKQKR